GVGSWSDPSRCRIAAGRFSFALTGGFTRLGLRWTRSGSRRFFAQPRRLLAIGRFFGSPERGAPPQRPSFGGQNRPGARLGSSLRLGPGPGVFQHSLSAVSCCEGVYTQQLLRVGDVHRLNASDRGGDGELLCVHIRLVVQVVGPGYMSMAITLRESGFGRIG